MSVSTIGTTRFIPASPAAPEPVNQPPGNRTGMPPPATGPGGRIPLGKGAGGRDGVLRAKLLSMHTAQRTQGQKDMSAQHAKELNEATKNALESALQVPGLTDGQQISIKLKLQELEANQNCDHLTAIQHAQSSQLVLDIAHKEARLGRGTAASPHRAAELETIADQLGEGITKNISLAMAATPASSQTARHPPLTYPRTRDMNSSLRDQNELTQRLNRYGDLTEKERVAYAQDGIAHGLMLYRDGPNQLSQEQRSKIDQYLHKLGTSELSELDLADVKNFERNLGSQFDKQRGAAEPVRTMRDMIMQLLDGDDEERKRKEQLGITTLV